MVAPHPDDEAIGCGGALLHHADRGDAIHVAFLSSGELGLKHMDPADAGELREREAVAAMAVLGIAETTFLRRSDRFVEEDVDGLAEEVADLIAEHSADLVYAPHRDEGHSDHRAGYAVAVEAARRQGLEGDALRLYEVWTPMSRFDHVEDVSDVMERKLAAIRCHASQLPAFDFAAAVAGLNRYRGVMAGRCEYAEVFRAASSGS